MTVAHCEEETFNDDEQDIQRTYGEMVDPCRDARGVFSRRSELVIRQLFRRQTRTTDGHREPEYQALISGSGLPLPNLKAKFARIEGAGSFPGRLKARSFSFLTIEVPICEVA
jgi:hypothetical protein